MYMRGEYRMLRVEIVITAYNVQNYISQCIQSALRQSYSNCHLLIIDDGSSDYTPQRIKEATKDVSLDAYTVVHRDNSGLADTRNYALDHLQGNCFTFLDGDDLIPRDYVSSLVSVMEKTSADLVACPFTKITSTYFIPKNNFLGSSNSNKTEVIDNTEFLQRLTTLSLPKGIDVSAHSKLYKNECWGSLRYPSKKNFEDSFVIFNILQSVKHIALTDATHYLYRYRPDSIVNSPFNLTRLQYIEAEKFLYDKVQNVYPNTQLAKQAHIRLDHVYLNTLMHIALTDDSKFSDLERRLRPAALGKRPIYSIFIEKIPIIDRIGRFALWIGLPVFNIASRLFRMTRRTRT